jgi:hypothetical protein
MVPKRLLHGGYRDLIVDGGMHLVMHHGQRRKFFVFRDEQSGAEGQW